MRKLVRSLKGDVKGKRSILQLEIKGRITGDMMELVEGSKGAMFNRTMLCAALPAERKDYHLPSPDMGYGIPNRGKEVEECGLE